MTKGRTNQWRHVAPLVAGIALFTNLALPPGASAGHGRGAAATQGLRSVAFSDSRPLPSDAVLTQQALKNKSAICPGGGSLPIEALTLAAAIDHAKSFLVKHWGAHALDAASTGPQARGESAAETGAAAAVLANSPSAALAAELVAHQKAPSDPQPLISAAALLPSLGMPSEALALLDAADKLHTTAKPMGVSAAALSKNNRGYALLALHRWAQAEGPLRIAANLAPGLTEAQRNLSQAELCMGQTQKAIAAFRRGARHDSYPDAGTIQAGDPFSATQPAAIELFDLSRGVTRKLPPLTYPTTPEQMVAQYDQYMQIQKDSLARTAAFNAINFGPLPALNPASRQRATDIIFAINNPQQQPGLRELRAKLQARFLQSLDLNRKYWTGTVWKWSQTLEPKPYRAACIPATQTKHGQWLQAQQALDTAARNYWSAYSKYATGLAANLATPYYHRYAEYLVTKEGYAVYYGYLAPPLSQWALSEFANRDFCVSGTGAADPKAAWAAPEQTPPAESCQPNRDYSNNLVINFDFVALKANCESVTVQIESEGFIKAFVTGEYNVGKGELKVIIGPKIGASAPTIGPFGGAAGVESGMYITVDKSGVTDWGMRVGPTATLGGPGGYEVNPSAVEVSFAAGVDYLPTAFGLAGPAK